MNEIQPESFWARCGGSSPSDRRNLKRVMWPFGLWAIGSVSVLTSIKLGLLTAGPISWVLATLPLVAAAFVLAAYGRFLRETDEMQRVIQLESLALGFGGTFFSAAGYRLFERLGAPRADIGDLTIVMGFFYVVGSALAWRRYR